MINDQLLRYIKQQLSVGVSKEIIIANLRPQGWTDADFQEAFAVILPAFAVQSVPAAPPVLSAVAETKPVVVQSQTDFSGPTRIPKSKKILSFIIVLILLGLAGGGIYAYYSGIFVSLPSLIVDSVDKAGSVTSGQYDVKLDIDFSEIKTTNSPLDSLSSVGINSKQLSFKINGFYDISDSPNPRFSSIVSLTVGGAIFFEAELRLVDKTFYARLTKIPALGAIPLPALTISPYVNKWFSFPVTKLSSLDSDIVGFTAEQKNHMKEIFRNANFIKTVAKLNPETAGGKSSYHFSFVFDRNAFISYIESLKNYMQTIDKNKSRFYDFDPKLFSKTLDQIKDFKGEIWIGRNDKLIHQLVLNFGVQPDLDKDAQVKINLASIFSDYNQPVSIVAPAESVSLETLISGAIPRLKIPDEKEKNR